MDECRKVAISSAGEQRRGCSEHAQRRTKVLTVLKLRKDHFEISSLPEAEWRAIRRASVLLTQGTAEIVRILLGVIALFAQMARCSDVITIGRHAGSLANIGIAGQRFPGLRIERCRLV